MTILSLLVGAVLGLQIQTTIIHEDCDKSNHEGKQCAIVKAQHELAEDIDKL